MNDIIFQYYPSNIKIPTPLGTVTLKEFIRANKDPQPKIKELFKKIKQAEIDGDMKTKAELKSQLFYFTPCVLTNGKGRSYSDIVSFNGAVVVEFDHIENASGLRDWMFNNLKSCICAYVSPSGHGVKTLFRIPKVNTVEQFKEYFYGLAFYFEDFKGFDGSSQNCILPLYLSYDPDLRFREDAVEWTIRGEKLNAFDENREIDFDIRENVDEEIEGRVIERIDYLIDKIEENAHPQILGISFLIGGWTAANYIKKEEAYDTMICAIERNKYMSKDTKGYCTTAKTMFYKGLNHPAEFKN